MGLDIYLYANDKQSHIGWSYHTIHILRDYAAHMVGCKDEQDEKAIENFPNLNYHNDAEGYYVGFTPDDWNKDSQLWVGSVEGLYKELQKISVHMIQTDYEGTAKKVLKELLGLFVEVEYDQEENGANAYMRFS